MVELRGLAATDDSARVKRVRLALGGTALLTVVVVLLLAAKTSLLESAGAGGVLGLFFTFGGLFTLGVHAIWRRKHKGTARLAIVALASALLALSTSALLARANRTEAAEISTSDTSFAPGEREARIERAHDLADNGALLGLSAVLPALGALFALVLAVGDRREATPLVPKKATGAPLEPGQGAALSVNVVWAALFVGVALLVAAVVFSVGAWLRPDSSVPQGAAGAQVSTGS